MRTFEKLLAAAISAHLLEGSIEELFERLCPDLSIAEVIIELHNAGVIPDDIIEQFVGE